MQGGKPGAAPAKPSAPAAAAGASKLAQYLCDPPPLRPDGRVQMGGRGCSGACEMPDVGGMMSMASNSVALHHASHQNKKVHVWVGVVLQA